MPLEPLTVQLLVLDLGCAMPARLPVQLAVGPLTVHAAVLDETAGRAVLELDGTSLAAYFPTVGAHVFRALIDYWNTAHATRETTIRLSKAA